MAPKIIKGYSLPRFLEFSQKILFLKMRILSDLMRSTDGEPPNQKRQFLAKIAFFREFARLAACCFCISLFLEFSQQNLYSSGATYVSVSPLETFP